MGFAPDFMALMSADLGFSYNILAEADPEQILCPLEEIEAYRTYLRTLPSSYNCTVLFRGPFPPCCLVAEKMYRNDLLLFEIDANFDEKSEAVRIFNPFRLKAGPMLPIGSALQPKVVHSLLNYSEGFPYVNATGDVVRIHIILQSGFGGEHVRSQPAILEAVAAAAAPKISSWECRLATWLSTGSAVPLTPIYSEQVATIIYTTAESSRWALFSPFEGPSAPTLRQPAPVTRSSRVHMLACDRCVVGGDLWHGRGDVCG